MALVKVSEVLRMADAAHTSILAFNCLDYNMANAVVMAAEEVQKPVMIALYPGNCTGDHWTTPAAFAPMVIDEAKKVQVPIALHLDHCSDFAYLKEAIAAGFQSVMYDGSALSVEENTKNTKEITAYAHEHGAEVEAELGCVGQAANGEDQRNLDLYTSPEVAKAFCDETGCDAVAIAIGSAHGYYKMTPKLDFDRLREINSATETPLVLHGGSGIPDDQLLQAFALGINKLNVGTEFFARYFRALCTYTEMFKDDPQHTVLDLPDMVQKDLMAYLREKLQLTKL